MRRLLGALAVALVLVAWGQAAAKSYYFPDVEVDVIVQPDGSFRFREERTFAFEGDFSWAFYKVERARVAGGDRVDIVDFVVGEDGRPYELGDQAQLERAKTPGTYSIAREGDSVVGRWYYRADDDTRTFDISYTVLDAVTVYDDYAQLYWKFIGGEWDVPTRRVSGTIHLPPGADKDRVHAWLHTTLTSEYWIEDGQTIGFRVENLPTKKFVEMRALFPPDLVPGATTRVSGPIWDKAFAEESRWVEQANRERRAAKQSLEEFRARQKVGGRLAVVLAALILGVWAILFARFGREHSVSFAGDYYRELPSERAPAVVGYLYRSGVVGSDDMVATILDLARRGYFKIREVEHQDRSLLEKLGGLPEFDYVIDWVNKDISKLTDFERSLVLFSSRRDPS
jgi:uncharacterized membrane protein